jgi:cytochrome c oxidase cbb3-type subunit 1
LPAWVISLSEAAGLLLIIPVLATVLNLAATARGGLSLCRQNAGCGFLALGLGAWAVAVALQIAALCPLIVAVTRFTLVEAAVDYLSVAGFAGAVLFGAIYHIVPRLAGQPWPSKKLVQTHLVGTIAAVGLQTLALVVGGVRQGLLLRDPEVPFLEVAGAIRPWLDVGILASACALVAQGALAVNFGWLIVRCLRACCPGIVRWGAERKSQTAEVTL